MYEESKLIECEYFLSRMQSETGNSNNFIFNLSAFLSSARSVLQYSRKEAITKSGGQNWYDNQVSSSDALLFFKDERDINVHIKPVQVNQHTSMELREVVYVSESIHIQKFDQNGNLIGESMSESNPPEPHPEIPAKVSHKFTFPRWNGTEEVSQLCELYLKELQILIIDGQNKGFLTK